jgi:flagellar M-ring protein FliF
MGELFQNLRKQAIELFQKLSTTQKLVGGGLIFVLVVAVGLLMFVNSQTKYSVLERGVSVQKAGEITAKLDELQIKWKMDNNSTTVLVDESKIDKARMDLTVSGVTNGDGITWDEALSKMSITMTSEEKNRLFLLAQQNALERAIKTLNGVEDAIINLYITAPSAFLNPDTDVAKASVILTLKSGIVLTDEQVNGIVMIMSNAVQGLEPARITITDQSGKQLNRAENDPGAFATNRQEEVRIQIEERMNRNLNDFLATIYGEDNVRVRTHVTLDFDRQSQESIAFSPPIEGASDGLVRSMTSLKEKVANTGSGGAPGTDSNTDTAYAETGTGDSSYQKASETLNYELNQVKTVIEKAEGQIKNLTIAVIINKSALVDTTLSDEHKLEIMNLVTGASGIGDPRKIQVSALDFKISDLIPVVPTTAGILGVPYWLIFVILGVMVVTGVISFIIIRFNKKTKLQEAQADIAERESFEEINTDFQNKSSPKYQIEKFIDAKPEAVAQLLRSWLNED